MVTSEYKLLNVMRMSRSKIIELSPTQKELKTAKARYLRLFEGARDGILILDGRTSKITDANPAMTDLLGYSHDGFLGKELWEIGVFNGKRASRAALHSLRQTSYLRYENFSLQTQENERRHVEFDSRLYIESGREIIQCNIRDITESKLAAEASHASEEQLRRSFFLPPDERELDMHSIRVSRAYITKPKPNLGDLRNSEIRYRRLFEAALGGILIIDGLTQKITDANPFMTDLLGYAEHELLTKEPWEIGLFPDKNASDGAFQTLLETGYLHYEDLQVQTKEGKLRRVEFVSNAYEEGGYQVIQCSIHDLTERRRAEEALRESEEQLRQSQKLEAIGQLAGGIAHDFNNLLTAILGYSELILKRIPPYDAMRQNIEEIKNASKRAADLTSQLLAFGRKQVLMPVVHNLNSSIIGIERMLRRIIKEDIEFRIVLDPDLGNIKADPGQIEQVIMNLAVNARDAMPKGGTLTIETRNIFLYEDHNGQNHTLVSGPYVSLKVTDTGEGMGEETLHRIFEPFYTTKDVGNGTGLGLSMVHGIVKQSAGDIIVNSAVGEGTTFEIYLPWVDEIVEAPKRLSHPKGNYSGTETILLVEDEEIVRNLVREILTSNGYHVLEASDGEAGLMVCSNYSKPIHLLLTDVIMPKMGGSELKNNVIKLCPDIKVMFMSGYTDDAIDRTGILDSDVAFIEKPFSPDGLARKVREILEC